MQEAFVHFCEIERAVMSNLWKISNAKEILSRHGFTFSKSLGQNFLINPSICPRMAQCCGADENSGIIEVGPGMGVLTYELSQVAKKVVAIELDTRLLPVLDETLATCDNVKVINADVLQLDMAKLIQEEFVGMDVFVCANLPYYITSQVVMSLLEQRLPINSITVMVQKEAANRLCAPVASRESGAVTVAVHYFSTPAVQFQVSRGSFMPAPNVDSAVIKLQIKKQKPDFVKDEKAFFKVVRAAFGNRRKTVVNSLGILLGIPKDKIIAAFDHCEISKTARAENLTLEQFAALANELF